MKKAVVLIISIMACVSMAVFMVMAASPKEQPASDSNLVASVSELPFNVPKPSAVASEKSDEYDSYAALAPDFSTFYYDSVEELYQGLYDMDPVELESISDRENLHMSGTIRKTRVKTLAVKVIISICLCFE